MQRSPKTKMINAIMLQIFRQKCESQQKQKRSMESCYKSFVKNAKVNKNKNDQSSHRAKKILSTLLHTKDSAPGPDGIPYSAWRVLPCVTVDALISYFYDIIGGTALPPMQVGVWIPKAKASPGEGHDC